MTCGNRSREIKGYTLKNGDIDKTVYVHNYKEMLKDMTHENKKPNSPDIWNKKPVKSIVFSTTHMGSCVAVVADHKTHDLSTDEIIVPVQRMFPNCGKYPNALNSSADVAPCLLLSFFPSGPNNKGR